MPEVAGKNAPAETPDDVAALYAWANLKGLKYHDFSASRRAVRAQLRERAAESRAKAAGATARTRSEQATWRPSPEPQVHVAEGFPALSLAGRESMLPQRFPRRRSAVELAFPVMESPERSTALEEAIASGLPAMPRVEEPSVADPKDPRASQLPSTEISGARAGRPAADAENSAAAAALDAVNKSGGVPAWIYGDVVPADEMPAMNPGATPESGTPEGSPVVDTLQHSRERVASRWYALRGVFDPASPAMEPTQAHTREGGNPVLAVFSLAGGVGKTSLTAALGRALSALGEKVLLADITSHGLLPFYFGSKELRPGVVRKFLPPPESAEIPISVVSYELNSPQQMADEARLAADLADVRQDFDRMVVDLSPALSSTLAGLLQMNAVMLVPIAPDMNSVIGLNTVERFFARLSEVSGRAIQPRYVLTQFDPALPLHLDVREVMRQHLGERLLPFVIRRSPAVAEALAEGMTVIDYDPKSGVADDYRDLANWVRTFAAPGQQPRTDTGWSQR